MKGGIIMSARKKAIESLNNGMESESDAKVINHTKETQFNLSGKAMEIIKDFRDYLESENKYKTTIKSYMFDVKSFVAFLEGKGATFAGAFQTTDYRGYITSQQEQNYKINTLNKRINSLQSFNHFLVNNKLMNEVIVNLKEDKLQ